MKKIFALIMFVCLFGATCHSQEVVFETFQISYIDGTTEKKDSELQMLHFYFHPKKCDKTIKAVTVYYHEETDSGEIVRNGHGSTEFKVRLQYPKDAYQELLCSCGKSFYPELLKAVPHTIVIEYVKPLEYFDDEYDDKVLPITDKNIKYYFPNL